MKTKAYVAINHSIGLTLSIGRRPSKIFLSKGHFEILSIIRTLAFESAGFLQRIEFGVQRTWKDKYMQKILFLCAKHNYFKGHNTIEPIPYLERTKFTSKSTANFAMQNTFKVRCTQEETFRYQSFAHFNLKELCMAKLMQTLDVNRPLSEYAAHQTPFFG